jgi:hypothetical protein
MPKRYAEYDDDDNLDENGLLKDGRSVRVPMMMRDADGLTDLQRSVRDHFAPARVVDAFGDAGAGLHRPGSRHLVAGAGTVDHAVQAARAYNRTAAFNDSVTELCGAWKTDGDNTREVARLHDTGDPVRDAYLDSVADLTTAWSRRR